MNKHYIDADKQMRKLEETKRLKSVEDKQVSSEVFDDKTLKVLYKLANKGYIRSLNGVISTGKEANVFLGIDDDDNPVAVKIYRVMTLDFKKIKEYIAGDPRVMEIIQDRLLLHGLRRNLKILVGYIS